MNSSSLRDEYFARACDIVEYIDAHLDEDLSLGHLADIACFSPRHFHRIFTELLGETPDDCVRRLRLERAASLALLQHAPTMTEIAGMCGFSTSALFSRNFARHFGASPTEWRAGMKRQAKVQCRQAPVASGKDPCTSFRYLVGEDDEEVLIDVLDIPDFTVFCVPYLQGYNEGVAGAFSRLIRWTRPRGLLSEDSRILSIPFDNPSVTPAHRCRNYAGIIPGRGVEVESRRRGRAVVRPLAMHGGRYFRARIAGGGRNLHRLYRLLYERAIPEQGFTAFGGRGFIEYIGRMERTGLGPAYQPSDDCLVHVPVRPAE